MILNASLNWVWLFHSFDSRVPQIPFAPSENVGTRGSLDAASELLLVAPIANLHDPAVQRVLKSRAWPSTYTDYEAMMDEAAAKPVNFTAKGDREIVAHIFFRMVYDISGRLVAGGAAAPVAPRFRLLRSLTRPFDITFNRRRSVRELRGLDDGAPLALSRRQSKRESKRESTLSRKDSQILVKRV